MGGGRGAATSPGTPTGCGVAREPAGVGTPMRHAERCSGPRQGCRRGPGPCHQHSHRRAPSPAWGGVPVQPSTGYPPAQHDTVPLAKPAQGTPSPAQYVVPPSQPVWRAPSMACGTPVKPSTPSQFSPAQPCLSPIHDTPLPSSCCPVLHRAPTPPPQPVPGAPLSPAQHPLFPVHHRAPSCPRAGEPHARAREAGTTRAHMSTLSADRQCPPNLPGVPPGPWGRIWPWLLTGRGCALLVPKAMRAWRSPQCPARDMWLPGDRVGSPAQCASVSPVTPSVPHRWPGRGRAVSGCLCPPLFMALAPPLLGLLTPRSPPWCHCLALGPGQCRARSPTVPPPWCRWGWGEQLGGHHPVLWVCAARRGPMSWSLHTWAAQPGHGGLRAPRLPLGAARRGPPWLGIVPAKPTLPSPAGITKHFPGLLTRLRVLGDVGVRGGPQLPGGCLCQHVTSRGQQTCPDKIRSDRSYWELPLPNVRGGGVSWQRGPWLRDLIL